MRRYPTGTTDQYVYFVAVDSTDFTTRETGLSSFTVYRARNGGSATAYTTPTIAEVSSSNMPGVYSLLLDEDMTIASGNKSEEVVLHITQASMAPVTLIYELYRPDVTDGETLTVSSGNGNAAVQSIANNAITAASIATGAIDADAIADNAIDAGAIAAGAITNAKFAAGAIDATAIAADAIGSSELAASAVTEIQSGLATSSDLASMAISVATILAAVDTEVAAIKAKTDALPPDPADQSALEALINGISAPTANDNADALLDRVDGVETGFTPRQVLRLIAAVLAGKASGMGTTVATFRDLNDTKDRMTGTVDEFGNRSVVTRDVT